MKMLYAPPPLFGLEFLRFDPIEVEVLEVDFERGMAVIVAPIAENSIVNILRKRDGNPPLKSTRRQVLREDLKPLSDLSK